MGLMSGYNDSVADRLANYGNAAVVTPSDTAVLTPVARALYIGVSGHVKVTTTRGDVCVFENVPVGILPVECKLVWSTGTAATKIVALT